MRAHPSATAQTNTPAPQGFRRYCADRILARAVNCLRQAAGGIVSTAEIIDWVWADDPEGGPSDSHYVGLLVMHLRRMGFPIASQITRGYRYAAPKEGVSP